MKQQLDLDKSISLVRAFRLADAMSLPANLKAEVKVHCLKTLGNLYPKANKSAPPSMVEYEKILLKIKQLVSGDASWGIIEPFAWRALEINNNDELKAKMFELCCLHGQNTEALQTLEHLNASGNAYMALVHPKIRFRVIKNLFDLYTYPDNPLSLAMTWQKDLETLVPLERLFIYLSMSKGKDGVKAYLYFRKYKQNILSALKDFADLTKINIDEAYMQLAMQSYYLGLYHESEQFVAKVSTDSALYDQALDWLARIRLVTGEAPEITRHPLWKSENWKKRLLLLEEQFKQITEGQKFSTKEVSELNQILEESLVWLPQNPDSITSLSKLFASYLNLAQLLPGIVKIYRSNALIFNKPEIELALWSGIIAFGESYEREEIKALLAVAKAHCFIALGSTNDHYLWESKKILDSLWQNNREAAFISWPTLQSYLIRNLNENLKIAPEEKARMLSQVQITADISQISLAVVTEYLQKNPRPEATILSHLLAFAQFQKNPKLEHQIMLLKAYSSHLENKDLDNLALLSYRQNNNDLGWRTLTLIKRRQNLRPEIWQAWQLSPENRIRQSMIPTVEAPLLHLSAGFNELEQNIAGFVLVTAKTLIPLLAKIDKKSKLTKLSKVFESSLSAHVLGELCQLPWFDKITHSYFFSFSPAIDSEFLAHLKSCKHQNIWGTALYYMLLETGVFYWGASITYLNMRIGGHIGIFSGKHLARHNAPEVERFFKSLDAQQLKYLQGMKGILQNISEDDFRLVTLKTLIRVTTLLFPNHMEAFEFLESCRAPVACIWDLEAFMLSPEYEDYRKKAGIYSALPIPKAITTMTSALTTRKR